MGRNKKSNKHREIKRFLPRSIKSLVSSMLLCALIYTILIVIFSILGLGSAWEIWKKNGQYLPLLTSLSLYRILEYTVPALIIKLVLKKLWREAFNYQFACYALLNAIVFLLGLDYALEIELFSSAESFIIIIGYIMSLATKDNITIDNTIDVADNN